MSAGLRVDVDDRNEKINYKVREHSLAKVPVMLVVGKREMEEQSVNVRRFGSNQQRSISLADAVTELTRESVPPDLRS
jgi:threonyl-tRNA synthetase